MMSMIQIIVQRLAYDRKAAEVFRDYMFTHRYTFIKRGLDTAVEINRVEPHDSHTMALLIQCVRLFMIVRLWADPSEENQKKSLDDEHSMIKQIVALLTDLQPPAITSGKSRSVF
jgi:hypothetical protein